MRDPDEEALTHKRLPVSFSFRGKVIALGVVSLLFLLALSAMVVLLAPKPAIPTRAESINVQASDLGPGWQMGSRSSTEGIPGLVDSSGVYFTKTSRYGGNVVLQAFVDIFDSGARAGEFYASGVSQIESSEPPRSIAIGEAAVFYVRAFSDRDIVTYGILFVVGDVSVTLILDLRGFWEDLSGLPFSSAYHLEDDFVLLARIVETRT